MQQKKTLLLFFIIIIAQFLIINSLSAQTIEKDTVLANKYFETAEEYNNNENFDTAIVYFEKASLLYEKHKQWRKYLLSEIKHGKCYSDLWLIDQAINIIKPAIGKTIVQISENDTIIANSYFTLGFLYYYKYELDFSLLYWKKTLEIRKKQLGEKHLKTSEIYNAIGILYHTLCEYDRALENYFKSMEIIKALFGERHKNTADTYNNIGALYFDKSDFIKAFEYYNKSLEIRKELFGEKHNDIAMSYYNIGDLYLNKNEYDKALEYFLKSLAITKEILGEKNIDVIYAYNNIGVVYFYKKKYDKALEYYFKSLEINRELYGENNQSIADSYNYIASVYIEKAEFDKAMEYFVKSFEISLELLGENHIDIAISCRNIGFVYMYQSKYDKALEYHFKSIEIFKKLLPEKHFDIADTYLKIGNVFDEKSDNNNALRYYQHSLTSVLMDFNDTSKISTTPIIKNYLDWNILLNILHLKANIFANGFLLSDTCKLPDSYQLALHNYQACDTLISQVRKDISTKSDKIALGEQASKIYKGAVNVCIQLSDTLKVSDSYYYKEQAFYFSEKNKSSVLLEALASAEALKFTGIPDTLLQIEHKLSIDKTNYTNLKNNAENDSIANVWHSRLFNTNRSYDSLMLAFETNYPDYYNLKYNNSPATVQQVSNLLDKKTAMLSYFVGDSTITIFAISKKDFVVVETCLGESLQKMISDYRFCISETDLLQNEFFNGTHESVDLYQELAYQLYNLLFPPEIQEFLKGGMFYNIENLIIIPDGQLATLPFETLLTEKYNVEWTDWKNNTYFSEMPYLIKDYAISYSYSATLFYNTFSTKKQDDIELTPLEDWLAFAPVFDGVESTSRLGDGNIVESLPGTETEVITISELFENNEKKAEIKLFNEANENAVKSGELKNYKILHFATHGFVNTEKPELSGIVLAQDTTKHFEGYEDYTGNIAHQNDGILYQSEIYNLELNSDLIVLSACETGLGKITSGEGVIGLTRALLYAGTDNIIVSLWAVSDQSTAELMVNFYENLLSEKPYKDRKDLIKFNAPLREAKLKMIEEGKYAHPYFWSPFILIGE